MNQGIEEKKMFPDLMRVKIRVMYNYCVCCVEVDTDTTSASGKQVYETFRIWPIKFVHALLSGRLFRFTVLEKG